MRIAARGYIDPEAINEFVASLVPEMQAMIADRDAARRSADVSRYESLREKIRMGYAERRRYKKMGAALDALYLYGART